MYKYHKMEPVIKSIIGQISVQIACFIIMGILLFGIYILEPNTTAFSFTIYGVSAVLFYNYCRRANLFHFILLALLYSILIIIFYQRSSHLIRLSRNISWFILIAFFSYYLTVIEKKDWYLKSKAWLMSSWLFGFIMIYVVMTLLNIFVFGFYPMDSQFTLSLYLKQSVKIGGTLGLGLGLGSLINSYIFKEKSAD